MTYFLSKGRGAKTGGGSPSKRHPSFSPGELCRIMHIAIHLFTSCWQMDHFPFRQTFELGIFIGTAEKSILNLAKW